MYWFYSFDLSQKNFKIEARDLKWVGEMFVWSNEFYKFENITKRSQVYIPKYAIGTLRDGYFSSVTNDYRKEKLVDLTDKLN